MAERVKYHTTIDKELLKNFKQAAAEIGVDHNTLLEAFMRTFVEGKAFLGFRGVRTDEGMKTETVIEFKP